MVKLIGSAVLALVTTWPALASSQVFPTCQDAYNYGYNTGQLYVGQAFAKLECDPGQLQETEDALVRAVQNIRPTFIDTDPMRLCNYDGLYNGIVERLHAERVRCQWAQEYSYLPIEPVSRFAIAVFASMSRSVRRPLTAAHLKQVFDRDYGPLGYPHCVSTLESAELEILGANGKRNHESTLNMLEAEICE